MNPLLGKLPICDITPFTLQDFPEHTACILWFGGCNLRCAYCHNPELVTGKKSRLAWDTIESFLESRKGLLDGVIFSGGECTLSLALPDFVRRVRAMGFKIKLDTNGVLPDMLNILLSKGYLDYVALDYKAPLKKFKAITGYDAFASFHRSLELLCSSNIPFEVRTTVHKELLQEEDILSIIKDLDHHHFKGTYFIQNFNKGETLLPLNQEPERFNLSCLPKPKHFHIETRNFG